MKRNFRIFINILWLVGIILLMSKFLFKLEKWFIGFLILYWFITLFLSYLPELGFFISENPSNDYIKKFENNENTKIKDKSSKGDIKP